MLEQQRKKQFVVNLHIKNQLVQIPIRSISVKDINVQIQDIVCKYNLKQKAIELIKKKIFQSINNLPPHYQKNNITDLSNSTTRSLKKSLSKKNSKYYNTAKFIFQSKKKLGKQNLTKIKQRNTPISDGKQLKSFNSMKKQQKQKQKVIESIIIDLRTPKLKDCDCQTEQKQKQNKNTPQNLIFQKSLSNEQIKSHSDKLKTDQNYLESENQQSQNHKSLNVLSRQKKSKKQKIEVLSRLKADEVLSCKKNISLYSQRRGIEQKNISQFNVNVSNSQIQQLQFNSPIRQLQSSLNNEYRQVTINQLYSQYEQHIKAEQLKKLIQDNQHKIKKLFQLLIQNPQTQTFQLSQQKRKPLRQQFSKLHQSLSNMNKQQIQNFNFNQFKQTLVKNQCCNLVKSFIE